MVRWPDTTSALTERVEILYATIGGATTLHLSWQEGRWQGFEQGMISRLVEAEVQGRRPSPGATAASPVGVHTTKDKIRICGQELENLDWRQTFGDSEPKEVVAHNSVAVFVGLCGWTF